MEWVGESSCLRATQPPEWLRGPSETKPQEPSKRPGTNRGDTDRGGWDGTKTHLPPEQPGDKESTAETAQSEADKWRR